MRVLIGYDGSECAQAALLDLKRAGLPDDTEALVLAAVDVYLPPAGAPESDAEMFPLYVPHGVKLARQRAQREFEEGEKNAEEARAKLSEMFPGWTVKAEAVAEAPHWALIGKCEEIEPDLVVVGSHGWSALGRFILGSVSQKVLNETDTTVRISRGNADHEGKPVKLLAATDGSPDAEAMIDAIAARKWPAGTQITVVTAHETNVSFWDELDLRLEQIGELHTRVEAKLRSAGLEVKTIITHEDPKRYLVREAEEMGADCIFLGAKGHRLLERFLIGSVSAAVAARAHCSVEVVRRK